MQSKPAIIPIRPGEPAMTGVPGSARATRRPMNTVRPGATVHIAPIGLIPRGTVSPSGVRTIPPLQPNSTAPRSVSASIPDSALRMSARVRTQQQGIGAPVSNIAGLTVNRVAARPQVVNVAAATPVSKTFANPMLSKNGPIGGYGYDAHAIPILSS
jgi:hypothetical protein